MLVTLILIGLVSAVRGFSKSNCHDDRNVIVHLFNWRHNDVALECERFLGPKGFCGVQVSPPNEHRVVTSSREEAHRPWWERYQPVSYLLETRSGTREDFIDMVNRCEAVGVRIYVDMVVNHMVGADGRSGVGSGGSAFDTATLEFPAVPYTEDDFNCCYNNGGSGNCDAGAKCYSSDCGIDDYNYPEEVRNCRLVGLLDLAIHLSYVRGKVRDYFDDLLSIGVAGFRVDACKHMWPSHLEDLYDGMTLPDGSQPFIFNEVIDLGFEAISGSEYYHLGRITNFKYGDHIANAFRRNFPLANMHDFGKSWGAGMYPSSNSLVFVDNHDNQRGHGAGGTNILTFYESYYYKLAVIFAQSWPYGHVRIMSSYKWPGGRSSNTDYGPPTNDGEDIKNVTISGGACDDGSDHTWVCEHRWRQIANMALWRNVAGGEDWNIHNWWDNGGHQIAFGRDNKAFLAINNDESSSLSRTLATGLPAGTYCDVISGNFESGSCTGSTITVDGSGEAYIDIEPSSNPAIAFHTDWKL